MCVIFSCVVHFLTFRFGSCTIDYSKQGYRGEVDLFVVRTILKSVITRAFAPV